MANFYRRKFNITPDTVGLEDLEFSLREITTELVINRVPFPALLYKFHRYLYEVSGHDHHLQYRVYVNGTKKLQQMVGATLSDAQQPDFKDCMAFVSAVVAAVCSIGGYNSLLCTQSD